MRRLLKHSFKSIFQSKVFVFLMITLILISGTTYTLFTNSLESFNSSLKKVKDEGKLHDYVMKENYSVDFSQSTYDIYLKGDNSLYTQNNNDGTIKDNKSIIENNLTGIQNKYTLTYAIKNAVGYYLNLNNTEFSVSYNKADHDTNDDVYRVIQSLINGKLVEDNSYFQNNVETNISKLYIDEIYKEFSGQNLFELKSTKSLSVLSNAASQKVVKVSNDDKINKIVNYGGTKIFSNSLTIEQMEKELEYKTSLKGWKREDYIINKLKGYRIVGVRNGTNSVTSVIDPSAFQAIISPAYASENNKQTISAQQVLNYHADGVLDNLINEKDILEKEKSKIIWVDNSPFFIIGVGTTPDFSFPIIDQKNPLPNTKTESIVFVNERGYERVRDAFREAPTENYISIRFNDKVSQIKQKEVLAFMTEISHDGGKSHNLTLPVNSWPNDIPIITSYNDENDQVLLTQERIVFLEKTASTISLITTFIVLLLIVFVSSVVVLIFGTLIRDRKKKYATLMSLGYSRNKISIAIASTSLIVGAVPSVFGYIVGIFMQQLILNIFSGTWTLPIYPQYFSLWSLLVTVIGPIFMIFLLIYIVSMVMLRKDIPQLFINQEEKTNKVFLKVYKMFAFASAKTKYGISLTFKNIGKLSLITVTTVISLSTLMVSISSIGVANDAYNKTISLSNYEFKVDLYSPTKEGEGYGTILESEMKDLSMRPTYGNPSADLDKPHWHVASVNDATEIHNPFYLKNKLQTKALLDNDSLPINPWDIAETLMPDNQKNEANLDYNKFVDIVNDEEIINNPFSRRIKFGDLLDQGLIKPNVISYKNIILNEDDEKYTYIDTEYKVNDEIKKYKILGFNKETNFLNIGSSNIKKLEDYISTEKYPILINEFISEKYNLNNGSVVTMEVENHINRNQKTFVNPNIKFEVVGILETYDDWNIFTLDSIANEVTAINEFPEAERFNGVFSGKEDPYFFNTIPLYSPSGLYMGTDTILGDWETQYLESYLNDSNVWSHNDIATTTQEFINLYSRTPFASALNDIDWKEISKYNFKQTSDLSNSLISIIQSIALLLSIVFAIIITSLIIDYNKVKVASLWALGYRKKEITSIFMKMYIIPIIIGLAISIGVSIFVISALRLFIISFGNILIPFTLVWWTPLIAIGVIMLIFTLATISSIYSLSNSKSIKLVST